MSVVFNPVEAISKTTPGHADHFYIALASEITIPPLEDADNKVSAVMTAEASGGFVRVDVSGDNDSAKFSSTQEGEEDAKKWKEEFVAYKPGYDSAAAYKIEQFAKAKSVILVPIKESCDRRRVSDTAEPQYYVMGGACSGVDVSIQFDHDQSKKGFTLTADVMVSGTPIVYDLAIPEKA